MNISPLPVSGKTIVKTGGERRVIGMGAVVIVMIVPSRPRTGVTPIPVPPDIVTCPARLFTVPTIESTSIPDILIEPVTPMLVVLTDVAAVMLDRVITPFWSVMPEMTLCWLPGINNADADTTLP
jgi:hypothetical protein